MLTQLQKEVIVGTLLGDASIERNKPTHNARIRFEQAYPEHETYLLSLYDIFSNISGKSPRIVSRKPDKRTGKVYKSISFKSLSMVELNYFSDLFYVYSINNEEKRRKTKIVPQNIKELLTARALAFWIADDGGISSYKSTILNTDSFTLDQLNLL